MPGSGWTLQRMFHADSIVAAWRFHAAGLERRQNERVCDRSHIVEPRRELGFYATTRLAIERHARPTAKYCTARRPEFPSPARRRKVGKCEAADSAEAGGHERNFRRRGCEGARQDAPAYLVYPSARRKWLPTVEHLALATGARIGEMAKDHQWWTRWRKEWAGRIYDEAKGDYRTFAERHFRCWKAPKPVSEPSFAAFRRPFEHPGWEVQTLVRPAWVVMTSPPTT